MWLCLLEQSRVLDRDRRLRSEGLEEIDHLGRERPGGLTAHGERTEQKIFAQKRHSTLAGARTRKQGLDPQKLLGHDDRKTTEIYLRDRIIKVVQGPTMRRILGA